MKKAIIELIKSIDKEIKIKFQKGPLECDIENKIIYIGH